ncbi:MAG: type I DNA topoisomerase [Parcubacteria group bacterium]|nr:type I DNA topoisomerase [Parcubacteria group bacterium]
MMSKLIIVESPTKAKTISKFLPRDYTVKSSKGHIRDLPEKEMGIDIEHNFEPAYVIPNDKRKLIDDLKQALQKSKDVILATDEDREGEAIAWHLAQTLKIDAAAAKRIVFHEITKKAIEEALQNPRAINQNLVDAQQARRVLDRLVGYELSPFLWKKIRYGLSAGRVQSVAVRLICEREEEIRKFIVQEYWTIEALFQKKDDLSSPPFPSKLAKIKDKTLDKLDVKTQKEAEEIAENLKKTAFAISDITKKQVQKKPPAPFTTSTLQQESSRKLGFSAKKTMVVAQQLYEGIDAGEAGRVGLITYMRTDSLNLASEAVSRIREVIQTQDGSAYLPEKPIFYHTKSKGAQEAHEAIRPTFPEKSSDQIRQYLTDDQYKLYDLIWRRTIACQMNPMILDATTFDIQGGDYLFRSAGQVIIFDGFAKIYRMSTKEATLPDLKIDDKLQTLEINPNQHFTEPPARYSEATLIKTLEEYGIGRPSTYAPTLETIQDRRYVIKNKDKKLEPTETGELVNKVLVQHFPDIVDIQFTAKMEENLDKIASAEITWQPIIEQFYRPFKANLVQKSQEVSKKDLTEEKTDKLCEKCGSPMIIKMGRFGKFLACSNYPACKNTQPLEKTSGEPGSGKDESAAPILAGQTCEKCGSPMVLKTGRYGKFIACSNYPQCKNTKPFTTGIKCPKCGKGEIAEKRTKKGRIFYGCSNYPECRLALWNKPTGELCPKCQSPLVLGPKGKTKCSNKECDYIRD